MHRLLLISLISFSLFAIPAWQMMPFKNGLVYIKNNTNIYLYCWIGQHEFRVRPHSNSRIYPYNNYFGCQ